MPQHTMKNILTRDFLLVFFAAFIFGGANHSLIPALPIYFAKLGFHEKDIGILVAIMAMAALVSRVFVGGALRVFSEKKSILFGTLLFGTTCPLLMITHSFWSLLLLRILQGIAFASLHTAALAYILSITPQANRGQGVAYFLLASYIAMAIAAPGGIFLINEYGFTLFFLSCTGICVCSFFLSSALREKRMSNNNAEEDDTHASEVLIKWKIITPAVSNFLQTYVFGALTAFYPLYAVECGVTNPGLFFTANAVVIMVGRMSGGKILDTYNKEKMIQFLTIVVMIAMIILSFSKTLPMFILVGLLFGTGSAFFTPACMAYAFEYAGSSSGAAVGTFQIFMDLGMALGPLLTGFIVPITGYPVMFLFLAFICFVNLVYFRFYVMRNSKR